MYICVYVCTCVQPQCMHTYIYTHTCIIYIHVSLACSRPGSLPLFLHMLTSSLNVLVFSPLPPPALSPCTTLPSPLCIHPVYIKRIVRPFESRNSLSRSSTRCVHDPYFVCVYMYRDHETSHIHVHPKTEKSQSTGSMNVRRQCRHICTLTRIFLPCRRLSLPV